MNIYIPLGLLLALFCFLAGRKLKQQKLIYTVVFLIILVFSAIRFGFGPDYFSYWDIWQSIQNTDISNYSGAGSSMEPLFLKFLSLFPKYTYFIVFSSILLISCLFFLFKKYVPVQYLWIIVLFLFLNTNCLIGNYVAMRSSICACLFIIAFHFLKNRSIKNVLIFVALILLAGQIHSSSIILLVFALLNQNSKSLLFNWLFVAIVGLFAIATVIIGNNSIVSLGSSFLIDNVESFDRYDNYDLGNVSTSLMALLFRFASLFILVSLVIYAREEKNKDYMLIYKIAIIASIVQLVFGQSLISDRYLLILNPFYIVAIIRSLNYKYKTVKTIMLVLALLISVYLFWVKMGKDYSASFMNYQTIFSQQIIP